MVWLMGLMPFVGNADGVIRDFKANKVKEAFDSEIELLMTIS